MMKNKIYTRTGDTGETDLRHNLRVRKTDPRIEICGTLDELNAHIGLLMAQLANNNHKEELNNVQSSLFTIGASIVSDASVKIEGMSAQTLEQLIDGMQEQLPPQHCFVLPGGCIQAAQAHVCRTVCRRAERLITGLETLKSIHPETLAYMNRLSDYFFVLSRHLNMLSNTPEKRWGPLGDKK